VAALETLYADRLHTQVEQLAHHAYRGELWEKSMAYYRQAGAKAAFRSAYREAVTCFEQAILALQQLPESPGTRLHAFDLRMELTRRLIPLAEYGRILENLREAEAIAEAQSDRRRLGLVCSAMTDCFRMMGNSEEAVTYGERALAIATELRDFPLQVLANQRLGSACDAVGDYHRAVRLLERNIALLSGAMIRERFGAGSLPAVMSRLYMVFSLAFLGEFAEAVSIGKEAIRIADEADTAHSQLQATNALGFAYLCKGDFDSAVPLLEQALHRSQIGDIPLGTRVFAAVLGYAYALAGRATDGIALLEQGLHHSEELAVLFRYALWLSWLGEAYLLAGRTDDARRLAERAVARASAYKEPGLQAYALRLLGEVAAHGNRPDVEQAEAAYRQALALADALGMRPLQAHCHFGLGALYGKVGLLEQARSALSTAARLFNSMEMTFWQRRADALLVWED
jgi:tetratricopeptide (TPR) repeat protein